VKTWTRATPSTKKIKLLAAPSAKDSGGELTVKSRLQDGQLQFSVSDTGSGLPAGSVDQIFSAFFTRAKLLLLACSWFLRLSVLALEISEGHIE
jgi:hypothetical protein